MNLNKAFILGRVTQDPRVRSLPSGQLVANFGIATNRFFYTSDKQKMERTEFHNIVAFNRPAEIVQQYLKQGSLVLVEGRLQTRSWDDKEGTRKYRTEIIVENLQLGPKSQTRSSQEKEVPERSKEVKKEEIPTIEEDSNPPTAKKEDEEEINVRDLPL